MHGCSLGVTHQPGNTVKGLGLRCTLRDVDGNRVTAVCLGIVSIDQAAGWRVRTSSPTSDHAGRCGHFERHLDSDSVDRPRRLDLRPKSRIPLCLDVDTIGNIDFVRLFTLTSRKSAERIGILLGDTHGRGDGIADDRTPPATFPIFCGLGRHIGVLSAKFNSRTNSTRFINHARRSNTTAVDALENPKRLPVGSGTNARPI